MELSEKLQQLRKQRGLTQEQVATELFVSRTAVSKWETGGGYPNLDSLKNIARLYSISVDELLSSEALMGIADNENRSNLKRMQGLVSGILDISVILFIFLPLYGVLEGDFIRAVSLIEYLQAYGFGMLDSATVLGVSYYSVIMVMALAGVIEVVLVSIGRLRGGSRLVYGILGFQVLAVMLFAASRQPYATVLLFLFFVVKVLLVSMAHRTRKP